MKYKKWTLDQKLEILSIADDIGIVEACRKYSVSTGTFYSWKKKFEHIGRSWFKSDLRYQEQRTKRSRRRKSCTQKTTKRP